MGSSNTAMDCAVDLQGHAEKVYLSHRHGAVVVRISQNQSQLILIALQLSRRDKLGMPVELVMTIRLQSFGRVLERLNPILWTKFWNKTALEKSHDIFGYLPAEWRLNLPHQNSMLKPVINEYIVDLLRCGDVTIVEGIKEIKQSGAIQLAGGQVLEDIDAIIVCTGYRYDFSILPDSLNPEIRHAEWDASTRTNGRKLHRLYQGIFSLEHPETLAILGAAGYTSSQPPLWDLATMALAQVWLGKVRLPSRAVMDAEIDKRHENLIARIEGDGNQVTPSEVNTGMWMKWLHDTADTGFNERFTYTWKGWWNWIWDWRSISNIMGGVNSPHLWRLYEGRRKRWDGADEALRKVNADIRARKERAKLTQRSTSGKTVKGDKKLT